MNARFLRCGVAALALVVGAPFAVGQEAEQAAPPPAEQQQPAPAGEDVLGGDEIDVSKIDQLLRGEQEVFQGAVFAYDPAGRRDPFVSLLEGKKSEEEEKPRPPGLPGMMIEELKLEGIIQTSSGILAFVQGRDNISYIIRAGTKLYNGEVVEILPKRVVFKQQVNDPKQLTPYQEVVREIAD
jgi:hypothetical protein